MVGSSYVTYTLLHSHLIGLAEDLLKAVAPRSGTPRLEKEALGVIILGMAAVEAAVSNAIERSFIPGGLKERAPMTWLARERISDGRSAKDRLKLLAIGKGVSIDWGLDPWMSLSDLKNLRNALVHFDSNPVLEDNTALFPPSHLIPLAKRLKLWDIHEQKGGTWLDTFLNEDSALWAFETCRAVLAALDSPPWVPS